MNTAAMVRQKSEDRDAKAARGGNLSILKSHRTPFRKDIAEKKVFRGHDEALRDGVEKGTEASEDVPPSTFAGSDELLMGVLQGRPYGASTSDCRAKTDGGPTFFVQARVQHGVFEFWHQWRHNPKFFSPNSTDLL